MPPNLRHPQIGLDIDHHVLGRRSKRPRRAQAPKETADAAYKHHCHSCSPWPFPNPRQMSKCWTFEASGAR